MWIHRYTVKGHGPFPMDMLRYDASYPQTTGDAIAITSYGLPYGPAREVSLSHVASLKAWLPTDARWRSFGWTVVKTEQPFKI